MSLALAAVKAALAPGLAPGDWRDPAFLVDAGLALELSGEALRPRLLFVSNPGGPELCLRPDMTLPIAQGWLADGAQGPARIGYEGRVFRAAAPDGSDRIETRAIGIERFADADPALADAEVLGATLDAVAAAGIVAPTIKLNDLSLFAAVLAALDLPEPWAGRLRAAAGRPRRLQALLETPVRLDPSDPALALAGSTRTQALSRARALVADLPGVLAGRSADAIAARLADKAAFADAPEAPATARDVFGALFAAKGSPEKVLERRRKALAGLDMGDWFARASARLAAIRNRVGPGAELFSDPLYQGNFWFYDGFLFSIRPKGSDARVVASGGRYDGLIGRLSGGQVQAGAVGCSILVEALEGASI
jgi:ATP phosphoribosyltransferase regulatory subunit